MREKILLFLLCGVLCLTGLLTAVPGRAASQPPTQQTLLRSDFTADPTAVGWTYDGPLTVGPTAPWSEVIAHSGIYCIRAENGQWHSPAFPVTPFHFYRLTFASQATSNGYWHANYYSQDGTEVDCDHYLQIEKSDNWQRNTCIFRAGPHAVTARISFEPRSGAIYIGDLTVTACDKRQEVAKWADSIYAAMPPLHVKLPAERWKYLPVTMEKLKNGGTLRVVMLGDSIVNDVSNSNFETLLERIYPHAHIDVISSVRGATGCWYYKENDRVQSYVLDYHPDLLIIGGISNGDAESVRKVVRQIHAYSTIEMLVMTGAVTPRFDPATNKPWSLTIDPNGNDYRSHLMRMAAEEKVAFLDMTGPFSQYAETSGKPYEWLQRDNIHSNVRGKQILGRILVNFFSPDKTK